jgi:hypothetical protein
MRRIYRHHSEREECAPDAMWRIIGNEEREDFVAATSALMADPSAFRAAMLRVIGEWPASCEVNLTASSMNHRAWMGHAGCFLATGSPEDCTRLGWHRLNADQQVVANRMADEAIAEWRCQYAADVAQMALWETADA